MQANTHIATPLKKVSECLTKNNFMECIIKEILLAAILGMFIIISFAKLHTWLNIKINIYNNKKLTNNLTNHEKSTPIKTSEADYSI